MTERPILKRGDKGPEVAELQRMLGMKGGNGIETFDGLTEAAVRSFQRSMRLPITGIADKETWRALEGRR